MKPLVSVITPTANRPDMLKRCIEMFLAQDYENKEMIIVGDDFELPENIKPFPFNKVHFYSNCMELPSIGAKRNRACSFANGEIIIHMDDDDYYSPQWISKSVEALQGSGHKGQKPNLTGLSKAYFHNQANGKSYLWDNSRGQPYVCEATMCYYKAVWERFKFPNTNRGEGASFCANAGYIKPHEHINDFVAMLHGGNTASHKEINKMKPVSNSIVKGILNKGKITV